MIDRNHRLSVGRQAKALGISRGSVYYLPRPDCREIGGAGPRGYFPAR